MTLVDSIIYPDGETYSGSAISETAYFEFLKTYSLTDATTNIISSVENAASQEGRLLLTLDVDYTSGYLYHEFNVTYKYYIPGQLGLLKTESLPFPVALIPLIYVIVGLLTAIVYYFLITYALKEIKEIIYGPPGEEGKGLTGTIFLAVALFGGAYLISKTVPLIREVRRPSKEAT